MSLLSISLKEELSISTSVQTDPSPAGDPRIYFQYGSDDLMVRIDRRGSTPLDQSSMIWDADKQRLQLREEAAYAHWQFLYDTAAGIPAVHRRPLP